MLERALSLLLAASWVYWLVAVWFVRSFFRSHRELDDEEELPAPAGGVGRGAPGATAGPPAGPAAEADPAFAPPVSVLKPVRGVDAEAYKNFATFCQQDFPEYEILFGVVDPADPVVPMIERLQRDFPERGIRLIVADRAGPNQKASILRRLAAAARHEILVMSDSDMRVTPDYLRRVVAPLADARVGLVTCPYVGEHALSMPAGLEALHMGVSFLPSVVVARRAIAMRFAMGASITVRRADLARIGGFEALTDYLAEDYQLGVRIARLGLRVHLSDYVMMSVIGATTFKEEWQREVRWARCTRVSRPREYPGLLFSFSTPLAGLLAWMSGFTPADEQALIVSLVLRWVVGWLVTGYTGDRVGRRWLIWLPVRDVLSALVWLAGGVGKHVVWRGEIYRLERGGRMRALGPDGRLERQPRVATGERVRVPESAGAAMAAVATAATTAAPTAVATAVESGLLPGEPAPVPAPGGQVPAGLNPRGTAAPGGPVAAPGGGSREGEGSGGPEGGGTGSGCAPPALLRHL